MHYFRSLDDLKNFQRLDNKNMEGKIKFNQKT